MSESAVSAKCFVVSLARNRRSPKRPSEPRPSGVHPEEVEVGKDGLAFHLSLLEGLTTSDSLTGIPSQGEPVFPRRFTIACAMAFI